jgi:dTDP-4-amino-4,6-dideoxygalactose transaminase
MTEIAALFCNQGLPFVLEEIESRNRLAARYKERLGRISGITFQDVSRDYVFGYKDFAILLDPVLCGIDRSTLQARLQKKGVETGVYFSPPMHCLTVSRQYCDSVVLPNTEAVAARILSLPVYSSLTDDEVEYVISSIEEELRIVRGQDR